MTDQTAGGADSDTGSAGGLDPAHFMVLAENVHKSFGRLEVLQGIDLAIPPGEVCCVLGPSGSGKSTFLRCINHLEKIEAGRIWVDGELVGYRQRGDKLHEMREREVAVQRSRMGMVFQRFNLFPHHDRPAERDGGALPGEGSAAGTRTTARRRAVGPGRPG